MKRSTLLLFIFVLGCHPIAQPTTSSAPLQCLSYEEPLCSACFSDDVESCEALVAFYQDGHQIQRSFLRAGYFWRKAQPLLEERCDRGEFKSCDKVGLAYWDGIIAEQDTNKARRFFQEAEVLAQTQCDAGGAEGCVQLASLYEHEGFASPRRERDAYERALKLGEGAAAVLLKGLWLRYHKDDQGFSPLEQPTQSPVFEASCQQGELARCITLGVFYQETNPTRSAELFDGACQKGSGEACFRLATMAEVDLSLLQKSCALDEMLGCKTLLRAKSAEAAMLALQSTWELSCRQGSAAACEHLLQANQEGTLKPEEITLQLAKLYEEDCAAGLGKSCYRWFRLEKRARAISAPEARPKTRLTLERGCAAGDASDCFFLGAFLIPKESAQAVKSIEKACVLGSLPACQQLSAGLAWGAASAEKTQYYACLAQELQPFLPAPPPCALP